MRMRIFLSSLFALMLVAVFIPVTTMAYGGGGGTIVGLYGATNNSCDADFNDDGKIDIFDLNILAVHWGSTNGTSTTGDANCDGKVDIFDLNAVAVSWSE